MIAIATIYMAFYIPIYNSSHQTLTWINLFINNLIEAQIVAWFMLFDMIYNLIVQHQID